MVNPADSPDRLQVECRVLCRYLVGQTPTPYVIDKYREGVRINQLETRAQHRRDGLFMAVVRRYPALIRVTDAYTSLFGKTSTFRMKLVLMLAILECCAPTHKVLDKTDTTSKVMVGLRGGGQALLFCCNLILGLIIFLPSQLFYAAKS